MLTCNHLVFRTPDIARARAFYIEKLGLTLLGGAEKYFAARAGEIRLSFFPSEDTPTGEGRVAFILRTDNVDEEFARLTAAGIDAPDGIIEAPDFMRFFSFEDPDGNTVHVGQYLRDPLAGY
jgi:catechol 2,3-dioxygenase-like lactoylglutathione lyase family enzyme